MRIKLTESVFIDEEMPKNLKINPKADKGDIQISWRILNGTGRNYTNRTYTNDGYIDTPDSVSFNNAGLNHIPFYFNEVGGGFDVSTNNLTSLEGCAKIVNGCEFSCRRNYLTSLEYGPELVRYSYDCSINRLESLKGCVDTLIEDFNCKENNLFTLMGCPKKVGNSFYCFGNEVTFEKRYILKHCDVGGTIYNVSLFTRN